MDPIARHGDGARDGIWLALVPIAVSALLGLLLVPRRAAPESVPLPIADARALAGAVASDHQLAELARRQQLPGQVRALGSSIRNFHLLETRGADAVQFGEARRAIDRALIEALPYGNDALLRLRAVELEGFLKEVQRFESTGEQSEELQALAGRFVRSMNSEGWCDGHVLIPSDTVLRVMFKQMFNALLRLEDNEAFAVTLDEQRALYAFYLSHPHPSKTMRDALASARRGARDSNACEALRGAERAAIEAWRLDRIARLAAIDPAYPADYARGVATFRRGDYVASSAAFRRWLSAHPEGPLTLRAQTYLRAAAQAEGLE